MDTRDGEGRTALMRASLRGHTQTVKQLLTNGAFINLVDNKGWTALMLASYAGHCETMSLLLNYGADTGGRLEGNGDTALLLASHHGHTEIVRQLLMKGADVNATKSDGWTALMCVSESGHFGILTLLLDHGADTEARYKDDDATSLIIAAHHGNTDTVKKLLTKGTNINACKSDGWTALMCASQNGHYKVVRHLTENGADVSMRTARGETALMIASNNGHQDIVDLLLKRLSTSASLEPDRSTHHSIYLGNVGDDALTTSRARGGKDQEGSCVVSSTGHPKEGNNEVMTTEKYECQTLKMKTSAISGSADLMIQSKDEQMDAQNHSSEHTAGFILSEITKESTLSVSFENNDTNSTEPRNELCSDVTTGRKDGLSLFSSMYHADSEKHFCGTKVQVDKTENNSSVDEGYFPVLTAASERRSIDILKRLLDNGNDISAPIKFGYTILMIASNKGHAGLVRKLLKHKVKRDLRNDEGLTALMMACENNHDHVVRLLLASDADMTIQDKRGWDALMIAAESGHSNIVRSLLRYNDNVTNFSELIQSALRIASKNGHCDVVRELIKWGGDGRKPDAEGNTPLMLQQVEII